ncbi:hypothetical protein PspLS_12010 [Pyricularia sp. CBS 133598]|nr:hypothetical protein PspLS_12010 [Pyricularia sp. CBS 133598]
MKLSVFCTTVLAGSVVALALPPVINGPNGPKLEVRTPRPAGGDTGRDPLHKKRDAGDDDDELVFKRSSATFPTIRPPPVEDPGTGNRRVRKREPSVKPKETSSDPLFNSPGVGNPGSGDPSGVRKRDEDDDDHDS